MMDFCQEVTERIYPVGRLDYLSEGLLLMTNDGEIANMVMHPSHRVTKVYEVKVFGHVNDVIIKKSFVRALLSMVKSLSRKVFESSTF